MSTPLACPNQDCDLFEVPYEVNNNTTISTYCGTCGTRIGLGTEDLEGVSGTVATNFTMDEVEIAADVGAN